MYGYVTKRYGNFYSPVIPEVTWYKPLYNNIVKDIFSYTVNVMCHIILSNQVTLIYLNSFKNLSKSFFLGND